MFTALLLDHRLRLFTAQSYAVKSILYKVPQICVRLVRGFRRVSLQNLTIPLPHSQTFGCADHCQNARFDGVRQSGPSLDDGLQFGI